VVQHIDSLALWDEHDYGSRRVGFYHSLLQCRDRLVNQEWYLVAENGQEENFGPPNGRGRLYSGSKHVLLVGTVKKRCH
jgi:hypothetical protein